MDPLAALLSERPPQQLSATELRSRIALLEDDARACRAELESRTARLDKELNLYGSQITDDGCAHLASRLSALPALKLLSLGGISASDGASYTVRDAVYARLAGREVLVDGPDGH